MITRKAKWPGWRPTADVLKRRPNSPRYVEPGVENPSDAKRSTSDDGVRDKVLASIKQVVEGEASISGAPKPPLLMRLGRFPLTVNDADATARVTEVLTQRLGADRVKPASNAAASEDFTVFALAWDVPLVFWFVGGTDPQRYAEAEKAGTLDTLSANHSPEYAPVLDPTFWISVETMLAAAGHWLPPEPSDAKAR